MQSNNSPTGESGFSVVKLIIILAVGGFCLISIMLIAAMLALPAMQKSIIKANETSAIMSVKTINAAEAEYFSTYPQQGFACSIASLGGKTKNGAPSVQSAQLISDELAAGSKSGYTFQLNCGAKVTINKVDQATGYTITAVPNTVGHTGDRGFCSDQDGKIFFDPKGGTACTDEIQ